MIDYEKLKIAHELAQKLRDDYSVVHYWVSYCNLDYFRLNDNLTSEIKDFKSLDDLIIKLQKLTQPKSKYKVGQKVWKLSDYYKPLQYIIEQVDESSEEKYTLYDYDDWCQEDELYPTREALIDAQIDYWNSKHCEDGRHEFIDDYTGYNSKCVHCEKPEFATSCLKNEEKSTRCEDMSMLTTFELKRLKACEHQSDGKFHCKTPMGVLSSSEPGSLPAGFEKVQICMTCGELYK